MMGTMMYYSNDAVGSNLEHGISEVSLDAIESDAAFGRKVSHP